MNSHDALCAYEQHLEQLRIEYILVSSSSDKLKVRAKVRRVIEDYYISMTICERQFALWLQRVDQSISYHE